MAPSGETTYDVRVYATSAYRGSRGTTYTVRWSAGGRRHQNTFPTAKLADSFRSQLLIAAREGIAFVAATGLPVTFESRESATTWLAHAIDYAHMKWPSASPRHRRGIAEALTDITVALLPSDRSTPAELRPALYRHAFAQTPAAELGGEAQAALQWAHRRSPTLREVAEARTVRMVLDALSLKKNGTAAAPATVRRKRATLHSAFQYAVELEQLPANPLEKVRWVAPQVADTVDRRVVVNPTQARALLDAVWETDPTVAALFACMYYAALRPAEARALKRTDCTLPDTGWGTLLLTGSHQTSGAAWTDSGDAGEDRGLKHRARRDTRKVPAHPDLVRHLRRHLDTYQCGPDGRLFVTRTGRAGVPVSPPYNSPVTMGRLYRAWAKARESVLTPEQQASPLARRPYDLRHACVSTWLNAGVPPAQVAEWAGHGVDVLLRVYAKCVDGADEAAIKRIEQALD